jgi:glyoxylase-like metal-dependent hydrolase (beta-lactamase superfamily II)
MVLTEEIGANVANTYLVVGSEGAAWIDTGWDRPGEGQARIDYWKSIGSPVLKGICFTHRHPPCWGNGAMIQRECGNPPAIAMAEEVQGIAERSQGAMKVDRPVKDGDSLSLGDKTLEFVFAPSHTGGLMAVYIPESRSLFTGDAVMGIGTSVVNTNEGGEIVHYLQTMQRFLEIAPAVIYPGQGPVVTDPRAKVNELIQHRHEREEEILAQLRQGPRTIQQLFEAIYVGLPEGRGNMARNQIHSQLMKLQKEERVLEEGETYRLR